VNIQYLKTDFLVVGGGTAGTMAGIKAKQASPESDVLILEKANIRRSGAIAMGMDGVNTAVIPVIPPQSSTPAKLPSPTTASSTRKQSTKPGAWALK
jgi:succinate dehydrogenase/fumarate reductase flavoprotein subunit